jgi:hypothetical protein
MERTATARTRAAFRAGLVDRLAAGGVVLAGAAVIFALARVAPDPRGHGTHELLGLAPCGFAQIHRAPCPTCGITTAACHVVHLQPLRALWVQPFGAALALAGIAVAAFALWSLVRRRPFLPALARLPYGTIALAALVAFLLAWGWKALTFAS